MVHEQSRNPEEDGGEEPSVSTVHSSQLFRTPPVASLRTDEDSGGSSFREATVSKIRLRRIVPPG